MRCSVTRYCCALGDITFDAGYLRTCHGIVSLHSCAQTTCENGSSSVGSRGRQLCYRLAFIASGDCSRVLVVVACFGLKRLQMAIVPLLLALVILVGTNLYGFQKLAVSPFGSVFLLARLGADGHIKPVLERTCPTQSMYLCDWKDRLAEDSDDFMWNGQGPVWSHPGGPIGLAPEATTLVTAAILANPLGVLQSLVHNTWRELWMVGLGDTLYPDHLDVTVGERLRLYFPKEELTMFQQSRQLHGGLASSAQLFNWLGWISAVAGLIVSLYLLWQSGLQRQRARSMLIAMMFVGLLANAFATGALSKPHYRYQTRIAWLLVFVPLILTVRIRDNHSNAEKTVYSG